MKKCPCGSISNLRLPSHVRSQKHINYLCLFEPEFYKKYRSDFFAKEFPKYKCSCGGSYSVCSIKFHQLTKRHLKYINELKSKYIKQKK